MNSILLSLQTKGVITQSKTVQEIIDDLLSSPGKLILVTSEKKQEVKQMVNKLENYITNNSFRAKFIHNNTYDIIFNNSKIVGMVLDEKIRGYRPDEIILEVV
jgi:hypothetical protein